MQQVQEKNRYPLIHHQRALLRWVHMTQRLGKLNARIKINLFISVLVPENFTEYVHGVHVFLVHWVTVPK